MKSLNTLFIFLILGCFQYSFSQEEEEDYSNYGAVDNAPVKRYAKPTISGMSPQRFISISFDAQMPYNYQFSDVRFSQTNPGNGFNVDEENPNINERGRANFTGGFRFNTNIPIISKSSFVSNQLLG